MDNYNDNVDRRSLSERWLEACARRRHDFAAGVNANRKHVSVVICSGCRAGITDGR